MTRINIILLGESGVGKTTLLSRFKTGEFLPSEPTIAVEFNVKKVRLEGIEVNVFLWDPSGQERYNAVVRGYYRKGEGVLLVYDVTDPTSFSKLSKWLMELKEINDECQVLIVGNKNDDPDRKNVSISMVKNFARVEKLEYMEISAMTGNNVEKAFDYLIRKVLIAKGILSEGPSSNSACTDVVLYNGPLKKYGETIVIGVTQERSETKSKSCC